MVQSKRFWNVVGEVDGENLSSALSRREEKGKGIELFRGLGIKVKSVGGGLTGNMYFDGKIEGDSQQLSTVETGDHMIFRG